MYTLFFQVSTFINSYKDKMLGTNIQECWGWEVFARAERSICSVTCLEQLGFIGSWKIRGLFHNVNRYASALVRGSGRERCSLLCCTYAYHHNVNQHELMLMSC